MELIRAYLFLNKELNDIYPEYLIIAFGVVIVGGLGSLLGTFLGGLILGLAQILGAFFLGPGFQLLSGYIILLIVLTFFWGLFQILT